MDTSDQHVVILAHDVDEAVGLELVDAANAGA